MRGTETREIGAGPATDAKPSSSFGGAVSARVEVVSDVYEAESSGFELLCELGGHRLVLRGECPVACEGGAGILLDGRIFNTADIAGRLDSEPMEAPELLLRAYRKWGAAFPRYLEGEFAFALWDREGGRVLLGCGPGGNFPLFYSHRGEAFLFARGLRDLLTGLGTTPRINENYLASWLALTFYGSDSTFFEGVFRVVPGSVLMYERGRIARDVYWQPEEIPPLRLRDAREYADGLREVLGRAIRDRLPGRSGAGSLLSGGLDSSAVTSLAAELLHRGNRRLHAFTAVPEHPVDDLEGRFCDEGPAAAAVAALWPNVDHVLVRHGRHPYFMLMDRFGSEQLEPIFNPANYEWLYEICLQARQRQLDTLLVGDSGNMSISYADRFTLHSLAAEGRWSALAELAREMRRNGGRRWPGIAYEVLAPSIPPEIRVVIERARGRFNGLFGYSLIRREFARRHGLGPMAFERSFGRLDGRALRMRYLRRLEMGTSADAFRRLTGVSRLDPTADRRVVEFCLSVPVEFYCEKGVPRSLIRNAMIGRLPEQVRTERRRGQQAADLAGHFRREREEALAELARMKKVELAARALDLEELERMMHWSDAQLAANGGRRGFWPKVMRAFSLGRFLRRFEDGSLLTCVHPESPDGN